MQKYRLNQQLPVREHHMLIPEMRRIRHIHFVGIGGAGMCGLAQVLQNQGYHVSGSDTNVSYNTQFLKKLHINIFKGHHEKHIRHADVVVISSAIKANNPEVLAANACRIPVISRAEMLAELMRYRHGIAISGTHGKTTTTSMIASVLAHAGLDPTFIIGGRLNAAGSNARLGESRILVAEADESDASFVHLQPMVSVVTNIEPEHMSTYSGDVEHLYSTFIKFLHNLPFYGLAVVCIDDAGVRHLLPKIKRHVITYGQSEEADIQAVNLCYCQEKTTFNLIDKKAKTTFDVRINIPGRHNVMNALAVYTVAKEEGVDQNIIVEGLRKFQGVDRRFQCYGEYPVHNGSILFVDDYGHHPTEIRVTIEAIRRGWPDKRLVMVFQPHRYSRTRDLYEDFVEVLSEADVLLLLDVYSCGEKPVKSANSKGLSGSIRQRGKLDPVFVSKPEDVQSILSNILQNNDFLLTQGAGSIGQLAKNMSKNKQGFIRQEARAECLI